MRVEALILMSVTLLAAAPVPEPVGPARPPIDGIESVAFFTTHPAEAARFWTGMIGARPAADPHQGGTRFFVNGLQYVELLPVTERPADMLARIAYRTPDVAAMRRYLVEIGHLAVGPVTRDADGARWIGLHDPEGVEIRFVQARRLAAPPVAGVLGDRIIHVGHLVRDRAREDGFYRQLLGFRPYWFGGMRAGTVDWVSQQVPDGRDWFEYMLAARDAPPPDARALGGMNHVSLGVPNVRAAMARLEARGQAVPPFARPLLGRDGKWQANLLDPDGTRVELMDFAPSAPPCCSPFTAPNPHG